MVMNNLVRYCSKHAFKSNSALFREINSTGKKHKNLKWYLSSKYYATSSDHNQERKSKNNASKVAIGLATGLTTLGFAYYFYNSQRKRLLGIELKAKSLDDDITSRHESEIPGLPVYTAQQVSEYDGQTKGSKIWVSFGRGVYEITQFVGSHPGGDKILMAAGGALEPFWQLYAVHKTKQVYEILEGYRIGNLAADDYQESVKAGDESDPYRDEPKRHKSLQISSLKPFNAETPLWILADSFLTPNSLFYVRNHLPVPVVDDKEYQLEIEIPGKEIVLLTLHDLKTKFPKHKVVSTIQCAGNRRSELNKIKEVKGLNWGAAAIGNAEWAGAKLVDVLKYAGIDEAKLEDPENGTKKTMDEMHMQFEGLDTDPANLPYGASIPAYKALDPRNDVLLAYEMNGEELPRDHGYPIRVVVPGVVGARNVKWLGKIILSPEESHSHWQRRDYKGFSPNIDWNNVDFDTSPSIQELPVNSAICKPDNGEVVTISDKGTITCRGYAWSGGGKPIVRVDVSCDQGANWITATLINQRKPGTLLPEWSWSLWEVEVPVSKEILQKGQMELVCKAVDGSYNVQPDTFAPIWNLRGVLANAWHKITVNVKQ